MTLVISQLKTGPALSHLDSKPTIIARASAAAKGV